MTRRSSLRPYPLRPCPCPADDDSPSKSPVSGISESQMPLRHFAAKHTRGACVSSSLFHEPQAYRSLWATGTAATLFDIHPDFRQEARNMYTPENFKVSDLQTLHLDMERWNFATLITPDTEGELQITHLPLLLKRDTVALARWPATWQKQTRTGKHSMPLGKAWPSSTVPTPTFLRAGITPIKPSLHGIMWSCTLSAGRVLCKGLKACRRI